MREKPFFLCVGGDAFIAPAVKCPGLSGSSGGSGASVTGR